MCVQKNSRRFAAKVAKTGGGVAGVFDREIVTWRDLVHGVGGI